MKTLVFTDLDGTLLDLETYSADKVKQHVQRLKEQNVSIIFCSSKTWTEQEHYLQELNLDEPAIVENGSGIIFSPESELSFTIPLQEIHERKALLLGRNYYDAVNAIEGCTSNSTHKYQYYYNQSTEQVAAITGLSLSASEKAKSRDFSETIFNADIDADDFNILSASLNELGFQCIPGSKYVTITGKESNKGIAVRLLIEAYQAKYGEVRSVGIGDSRNDLEMLEAVQFPYLVKRPDNTWANIDVENICKASAIGPDGWTLMAEEVLAD